MLARIGVCLGFCLVITCAFVSTSCDSEPPAIVALKRGTKLLESGRYAEASLQFRKAIQKSPTLGQAYLKLGIAELKQSNVQEAESALKQATLLMPQNMEPVAELADLYVTTYLADPRKPAPLYERISKLIGQLLEKDSNSFSGLRLSGYLAAADNKPKEAIDKFDRAHRIRPDSADVLTMLVANLFRDGQSGTGESLAKGYLEKHPDNGPLYDILYAHFKDAKREDQAEDILKLKVANNPRESFFVTQLCRYYWNAGQRDRATALLDELTANPGRITNAHLDVGDFYAEIQDVNRAVQSYEAGLRLQPKEKLVYQRRTARALLAAGRLGEAEKLLGEILKDHPQDEAGLASLAALHISKGTVGDLAQAISELKSLIAQKPSDIEYRYQLGRASEMTGDENSAKEQYLGAIHQRANHIPSLLALAHLFLRQERFADAQHYADLVLAATPNDPSARLVRSATLAGLGNYRQTRMELTSLIRDYPTLEGAYIQLGLLELIEKRYAQAEDLFRKHYRPGNDNVLGLKGLVELYSVRNQFDKAIALIQGELEKFPESVERVELLGDTATRAGKYDLAIVQYQKLERRNQASAKFPLRLGMIYEAKGEYDKAIAQFQTAKSRDPKDPSAPALLGRVLEEAGRQEDAIASYKESLLIQPDNPSVQNNLAFAMAESNRNLDDALKIASQALRRDQGNPAFMDTVGWIYFKQKDYSAAFQIFRNLKQKQPGNADFRIHLARTLIARGDSASARTEILALNQLHISGEQKARIEDMLRQAR
jgi:tetratricopeptide (TPR) repeat protein